MVNQIKCELFDWHQMCPFNNSADAKYLEGVPQQFHRPVCRFAI